MHQIPTELLQKILNYLQLQPFNQVAGVIAEIQKQCVQIREEPAQLDDNGPL